MKSAIFTSFAPELPFVQALGMIRETGFEVVSIGSSPASPGYATAAGRLELGRQLALHQLTIDSVHAPFPGGDRLFSLDEEERLDSVAQCEVALAVAEEFAGRMVVVHLIQPYGIPAGPLRNRMIDQGRRSVERLAAVAADRGVKLALENGQRAAYDQVLVDLLEEFNASHVGLCYDTGHENVQGSCFALLEKLGGRLLTLHIHDNEGADTHVLPGEGTIDWEEFARVLQDLDYSGNLLLEAGTGSSGIKDPAAFLAEGWRFAEGLRRSLGKD